jgi:hypothetical protein
MNAIKIILEIVLIVAEVVQRFVKGTMLGAFFMAIVIVRNLNAETTTLSEIITVLQRPEIFQAVFMFGILNITIHFLLKASKISYKRKLFEPPRELP